ncbi:hypothetical protein EC968_007451 [Mortierella alpina]|nr:hypothetical protein EC968_007451 [Mortierella alpina]
MSTSSLSKSNSSSWGVKQFLKVAVGLLALSQLSNVQACSPTTISVSWEQAFNEVCKGKACASISNINGGMYLNIRDRYEKWFYYTTPNGRDTIDQIGKKCSPDKVFCIEFYGLNDVTLHYANQQFKLGAPNVRGGGKGAVQDYAEYWHCL